MIKRLLKLCPMWLIETYRVGVMSSYNRMRNLLEKANPELFEGLSHKYLDYNIKRAKNHVPAYQQFLKTRGLQIYGVDATAKLPTTDKENYIFSAPTLASLCLDGDISKVHVWVKSSGHSGKERDWGKSNKEIQLSSMLMAGALDGIFNFSQERTLVINGYILGGWVTGISFAMMFHERNAIINIGPHEEEIFQAIEGIGKEYEQIIVLGYPPFIKHLVEYGCSKKFVWKDYNIHLFVGGEFVPEEWREYIMKRIDGEGTGKNIIIAGYGASDFGMVGAIETPETIKVRKLAMNDKKLGFDLFNNSRNVPMLFQYSPFLYINADENRDLHFTTLLPENPMPLINYNLQDSGGVITYKDMKKILLRHGIDVEFHLKVPFLFVEGRSSGALKLCAFMIYPENIKQCVYRVPEIARTTTGKFKMYVQYDKRENERFCIDFELVRNVKKTARLAKIYAAKLRQTLKEVNEGYKAICQNIPKSSHINIKLYSFGEFPHTHKIKYKYT